mmetsp:Transcript_100670/g.200010  ORF Transcript_100670/g.200010 Transcript_100670/m.200010 type:complete len:134 (-) Transcript_100670:18-419(-)
MAVTSICRVMLFLGLLHVSSGTRATTQASGSLQPSLRAAAVAGPGDECEASFNGTTTEERCNAVVEFIKGGHGSIPDKYWPEKESCDDINKLLAKYKEVLNKCNARTTCWKFVKGTLPVYISRYERAKKEKKC